jgi:superfamily II DNA or RNA helicase
MLLVQMSFLFTPKNQLLLKVRLFHNATEVSLSLAQFMQYLYEHEAEFSKEENDFCYTLAKLVKKVDFKGRLIYAIPNDYDMAMFFKKIMNTKIVLKWERNGNIQDVQMNAPLPITVVVSQAGNRMACSLQNRKAFLKDPMQFLIFKGDKTTFCFSNGVLAKGLRQDFQSFLNKFMDKDRLFYADQNVIKFVNHIYKPNRQVVFWKIQVDFLSFLPQETPPIPLLRLDYLQPNLVPTLFYKYNDQIIDSHHEEDVLVDKRTLKKYQRMRDMEAIFQQDLMTLFQEYNLPFMLENPGDIAQFMDKVIPILKDREWEVESNVPDFQVLEDAAELEFSVGSNGKDWFHFEPNCEVAGQNMSLQEIAALMVQNQGFVKTKQGFVKISEQSQKELKALSDMDAFKTGKQFSHAEILPLITAARTTGTDEQVKSMVSRVKQLDPRQKIEPTDVFKGELRDYQQFGVNWMGFLAQGGLGGILADDMGLGKTVQTIALSTTLEGEGPVLVIGPTNVIYNWEREIQKFAPSLSSIVYTGATRDKFAKDLQYADFVITSFGILKNDLALFSKIKTRAIFVDEAQYMKNPKAQISRAVKALQSPFKLAMTGTPVENQLQDLWNLFDFAMPGYLGTQKEFDIDVKDGRLEQLKLKVKPFVLRREKREVLTSLPEKTEITLSCPLSEEQFALYKTVLDATRKGVMSGGKRNRLNMLTALLKLRQVCIHPALLKEFQGSNIPSAKYDLVREKLTELMDENHKVVVFTQFTSMLDIMEDWLKSESYYFERIDGSVTGKARMDAVTRFQEAETGGVFIVSLKAGGVGINLTAADYVIHLDPWWNPAIEAQATDRVHRMGQQNKVIVYKMISEGTIEEKIQELQQEKRELLAQVVDIDSLENKNIDVEELTNLILA